MTQAGSSTSPNNISDYNVLALQVICRVIPSELFSVAQNTMLCRDGFPAQ